MTLTKWYAPVIDTDGNEVVGRYPFVSSVSCSDRCGHYSDDGAAFSRLVENSQLCRSLILFIV